MNAEASKCYGSVLLHNPAVFALAQNAHLDEGMQNHDYLKRCRYLHVLDGRTQQFIVGFLDQSWLLNTVQQ